MTIGELARVGVLAAAAASLVAPAMAQSGQPGDSNVHYGGMLKHTPPAATPPPVAAPPAAWPRLDPGAVICRSHDDLVRRAELMRGEQVAGADCHNVSQPTAIKILNRAGPGATEVQITGRDETGWTDAWLPANPPSGTRASR